MIDFHTHSAASDGALSASDLIERAAKEGVSRLALTDHDTVKGYLSVYEESPPDLDLISGVELSCQWGRVGIHVVGLGFEVQATDIRAHLLVLDAARKDRAERIAHRLERAGMQGGARGCVDGCSRSPNWSPTLCALDGVSRARSQ